MDVVGASAFMTAAAACLSRLNLAASIARRAVSRLDFDDDNNKVDDTTS